MNQPKIEFINKLKSYFNDLTIEISGKTVCVCLSGGADSVSLLLGLIGIKNFFNFNVCAAHFNHMIRGPEADRDELFCKELCKKSNVKLYCGRDDVPAYAKLHNLSIEAAARECRYAFFERICERNSIDYYATAHNMNDDAETLLLNLIRGSGSNGASAISPVKDKLLRPLLKVKRSEIELYLAEHNQTYVTDSTNESSDYTRNFIRHKIIPLMEELNPIVIESFSKYIDISRTDRDYFDNLISDYMDSDLRDVHSAVRNRVIINKFYKFCGKSLNNEIITQIENAILTYNRYTLSVFNEYEAVITNGRLDYYFKNNNSFFSVEKVPIGFGINNIFADRVTVNLSDELFKKCENINKLSTSYKISFDNIVGSLCVRNRAVGDKICIRGINRSLKKLFIEKHIPKEYRDTIPVILDDKGIVCVPFVGIDDRFFPTVNSKELKYIHTVFNMIDTERWNNAYEKK